LDVQTGKTTGMVPVFPLALPLFQIRSTHNCARLRPSRKLLMAQKTQRTRFQNESFVQNLF
jgi:hypothetical protein